ncbi:ABC transporter substrate-binding protein [Alicyclobacillus fructus]|nr:ABC transporter substrate-binding protein [Alicyclobacillus fructus]
MPGKLGKELQKLTDEFEKQNPNIHVQLIFNGSYSTLEQKLTAAISSGTEPTVAQVEETWETNYVQNGLIEPLDAVIPKSTQNDLIPIWRADSTYHGKLMSVPFNKSAYVLYYNVDDLKKAGISSPPKTWSELEQDALQIEKKEGIPGLGLQGNYYTFEMLLKQAGGQILNASNTKAAFNSSAGLAALNFMKRLVDEHAAKLVGANEYLSDGFNTNEYAMDLDTVAAMSFITNPNTHYKVAPLPKGVTYAVPTAGLNLVIFNSASAAQKAAAAKYLNFLISVPSTIEWAEQTGYLPVRQSALTNPSWTSYIKAHPNQGVAPNELQYAYFSPRIASLYSAEQEMSTQIGNMLAGRQTPQVTLQNMVNLTNQALAQNNS